MNDDHRLPTAVPASEALLTNIPFQDTKSRRALFGLTANMISAALHPGPARALLEPALKTLTEAASYEAGLTQFHKEALGAFAEKIEPVSKGPGGDFLAKPDLSRNTREVVRSIRDTVDLMSDALRRQAKGDQMLLAVNGQTRIHLDLLHLELLIAIQRLATDQQSVEARGEFVSALGAFLEKAKRSFLAD